MVGMVESFAKINMTFKEDEFWSDEFTKKDLMGCVSS